MPKNATQYLIKEPLVLSLTRLLVAVQQCVEQLGGARTDGFCIK